MNKFLQSITVVCLSLTALSQSGEGESILGEIYVVDTTTYNGNPIYVFNDKSWEFVSDYKVEYIYEAQNKPNGTIFIDSFEIQKNYNENMTFNPSYDLKGIVDSIDISVSNFYQPTGVLSSDFKFRWGKWHLGEDYAVAVGTKVVAAWDGFVRYSRYNYGGYGNMVIIRHFNGLETVYAHLSKCIVKVGDWVKGGELVAYSGNSGRSTGPHLHFEIRILDNAFNPAIVRGVEKITLNKSLFEYKASSPKNLLIREVFKLNLPSENILKQKSINIRKQRQTAGNL